MFIPILRAAYLVKAHIELNEVDVVARLVIEEAAKLVVLAYKNIWRARDEKRLSMDAAGNVMGFVGIDICLAEGGMGGKMVPIAVISSMRVLMNTSQMVLGPMDGIVMTVEFVQQAPDAVVETEHICDNDERVRVRDELYVVMDSGGVDHDGIGLVLLGSWS